MASGNSKEKKLARELQERTGLPYTECLRRVREEHAEAKKKGGGGC